MRLPASLAPLRHPAYARVWFGAFVSNIGTWVELVAVGVLVTETTRQAGWAGLAAAAAFLPGAIFAPIGGALADRVNRRALLVWTTSGQLLMACVLTALAATGHTPPGLVVAVIFVAGCVHSSAIPVFQAILPDLVPQEDLVGAVALSSAQWNLGRIVGPAIAGVVLAMGGYAWAFGINAASFLAVIAVVLTLRLPPPRPHGGESVLRAIRDGFSFVRRDPGMRVVVGFMALASFLAAPFIALVPAMAINVFDGGAGATAVLVTAQGVGAVAMALSMGALAARIGAQRVLVACLFLVPPAIIVYGLSPTLAVAVPAILLVGFLYLGALSSFLSIAQLRSAPEVRGRVMSIMMVILAGIYPLGSVLQGALADRVGLRTVTVSTALLMLAILIVARLVRPGLADDLDAPTAEGALLHTRAVGAADPVPGSVPDTRNEPDGPR